jgi:hypothetical protein
VGEDLGIPDEGLWTFCNTRNEEIGFWDIGRSRSPKNMWTQTRGKMLEEGWTDGRLWWTLKGESATTIHSGCCDLSDGCLRTAYEVLPKSDTYWSYILDPSTPSPN